ncbi:MAG: hypothetical protein WDA75_04085 [Candidatus Latescibacterota bacterium]|jgi:hypothetical protein
MELPRRDTFKAWLADVGYLYLVVAALVLVAFLVVDLLHARGVWGPGAEPTAPPTHLAPYNAEGQ